MYIGNMAKKPTKRPRDPVQLAKLIGDIATGQIQDSIEDGKNPKRVAAGSLGGLKGGKTRANKLTPQQRKDIARIAANKRWKKPKK